MNMGMYLKCVFVLVTLNIFTQCGSLGNQQPPLRKISVHMFP